MNQSFPTQSESERSRENFSNFPHSPFSDWWAKFGRIARTIRFIFGRCKTLPNLKVSPLAAEKDPGRHLNLSCFFFALMFNNLHAKFDASDHLNCTAIYWRNFPFTSSSMNYRRNFNTFFWLNEVGVLHPLYLVKLKHNSTLLRFIGLQGSFLTFIFAAGSRWNWNRKERHRTLDKAIGIVNGGGNFDVFARLVVCDMVGERTRR